MSISQRRVSRIVRALIYPVGCTRPHIVFLPIRPNGAGHPDTYAWAEDVDVARWFPEGARHLRIATIPSTAFPLINDYTIITSAVQYGRAPNGALRDTLGVHLNGNLIVLRIRLCARCK